ncbi:Abi family protein [Weissella viridescens]|uniref:Abi family protein n=1 Tax=Weissella viridescens TaxID=1629 RepID=UPI001C7D47AB|nr:Abi family protein [Weissella viridescens]
MVSDLTTNSTSDLLEILSNRGMDIDDDDAELLLENIGYYKLKEYAQPFFEDGNYNNLSFKKVVKRYYYDKNLRIDLLHIIELIELSFKNQIAEVLGANHGKFGYLDFVSWADVDKFTTEYIINEQTFIKKSIKKMMWKSNRAEYRVSHNLTRMEDQTSKMVVKGTEKDEYPTVWLALDLLSLGELHHIYKLMPSLYQEKVATKYKCGTGQLNSWMGMIVLTRNICAHNTNLVDVRLKTVPKIKIEWQNWIIQDQFDSGKTRYSNHLASVITPIVFLTHNIQPDYGFGSIVVDLKNLSKPVKQNGENLATLLGFYSRKKMLEMTKCLGGDQ